MIGDEADLICIGAGFAGLTAGVRAAELGLAVIVLETQQTTQPLNNSRIATGVFHVASNDVRLGEEGLIKAIEIETAGYAKPELARAIAVDAARSVDWLAAQGVRFEDAGVLSYVPGRRHIVLAPRREMRAGLDWEGKGGDQALEVLSARLAELGGRLITGVKASGLVMEEGRCVGLEAIHDGGRLTYKAGAVLVADGGFQANPEMLKDAVTPEPARVRLRATPSATGDGIRMAEAIGARITEIGGFYGHILCAEAMTDDRLWPYPNMDVLAVAAILVDGAGERFVDEGRGAVFMTNAIAKLSDPLSASIVMTRKIWDEVGTTGVAPPNPEMTDNGGTLIEAPDIAGIANAIGIPAQRLHATIVDYNQALADGALERLTPPRTEAKGKAHPIHGGPYCAIRVCAGVTNTMGGIDIDGETHALDRGGVPIAGLYAAGSSTGGLEGGPNVGYVGGIVKAFVLGLRAGEAAARDLGKI